MISPLDLAIHLAVLAAAFSAAMLCKGSLRTAAWAAFAIQAFRLQLYVMLVSDAASVESWALYTAAMVLISLVKIGAAVQSGFRLAPIPLIILVVLACGAFVLIEGFQADSQLVRLVAFRFAIAVFLASLCLMALVDMITGKGTISFALFLSDSADFLVMALSLMAPALSVGGALIAMHVFEIVPWGSLAYLGYTGSLDIHPLRGFRRAGGLSRMGAPQK